MTAPTLDARTVRSTWRSTEAVHGMIYFTPDTNESYAKVGVTHARAGYFASRIAALGAASAELTIATFYNFSPRLIRKHVPMVWDNTTPHAMLTARLEAVDSSLRRAFGDEMLASAELLELSEIVREAALVACESPEGRALFAGHAALPWPDEPHLVLWHAQTLVREHRGDGHIAALTCEGLSGLEALISHAASGEVPTKILQATRAWTDDQWNAAATTMVDRGLVLHDVGNAGALTFTDAGRAQRDRIEATTDRLAAAPYEALGLDRCNRWRELGKPFSQAVVDAGLLTIDPARYK
jgi:hypothetical protein